MPKIAFVPADGLGRTRAEHRRLIRSHCMRGKNKKKYRNTRDVGDHTDVITQQLPVDISVSRATSAAEIHSHTVSARPAVWSSAATGYTLPSPERPPSVFSLLTFAREIDDLSRELLFKYFFVAREIFYPIQFCVYSDASLFIWFEWLFYDVAYLEAVLLGMSAMDDFYRRAPPSKLTYSSLKATIHALNKRLSDPDLCLADSTIAVVMGLAELAGILSDDAAVKAHVSGFQKMVRLRGGISAFAHNKKLQIKIGRFDLIHSLGTGNPPQFFMDPISWCPIFGPPSSTSTRSSSSVESADHCSPSLVSLVPGSEFLHEPKLKVLFHDLLHFTTLLNASLADPPCHQAPLRDTEYQTFIGSIQYRLLQLQDKLSFILDEATRLAMLALLTSTVQVAGQRLIYSHLERRFREFCRATKSEGRPDVALWLLIVGAMSVFHVDGGDARWMTEFWRVHIPADWEWEDGLGRLRMFPWIRTLHDEAGRTAFQTLCREARALNE